MWQQAAGDNDRNYAGICLKWDVILNGPGYADAWTPQKMAIEWKKVDIALFSNLPREDDNLSVVVEAKKKGNSCLTAISQAQRYAEGKQKCMRLIVPDGLRYGIYLKNGKNFYLYAYFNITDLKESYPIYECHGVKEALRAMTPEWMSDA